MMMKTQQYIDTNTLDSMYLVIEGYTVAIFKAEDYFKKLASNDTLPIFALVRAMPDTPENTVSIGYVLILILIIIISVLMYAAALDANHNSPVFLIPVLILEGLCVAKIFDKLS